MICDRQGAVCVGRGVVAGERDGARGAQLTFERGALSTSTRHCTQARGIWQWASNDLNDPDMVMIVPEVCRASRRSLE
jgi:hypothetical protein